jgi:hypothetical protein
MADKFWWFQGATVLALRDRLAGATETTILKCIPEGDKLLLDVVEPITPDASTAGPLNESYICPPICPH